MRAFPWKWLAILVVAGLSSAVAPSGAAQEIDSMYGPLPVFEFHSGFWVNLHHFLYHEARAKSAASEATSTPAKGGAAPTLKQNLAVPITLSAPEQKTWDDAVSYYVKHYAGEDPQVNIDLILLKDQLSDFEDCGELTGKKKKACDAGLPGDIGTVLESVAGIYRKHWWADQDRSNRRWVIRVAPLVREQGVGLSERLAEIYQAKWPKDKIRVEVVAYANATGAYTTLEPLRVTISSTDPRNQGTLALEVLFHEASHEIALPVEAAIARECRQREKGIPRNLWHALIFYTTGEVLAPILQGTTAESSAVKPKGQPVVPSELQEALTQRGWEDYLQVLRRFWQPYLDGKVTFEDAIAHIVSAI